MKKTLSYNVAEIEAMRKRFEDAAGMTTAEINLNYLIKVHGQGFNQLVGVAGLLALVGIEKAVKMLARANKSTGDCCTCRVYGQNLAISFYIH